MRHRRGVIAFDMHDTVVPVTEGCRRHIKDKELAGLFRHVEERHGKTSGRKQMLIRLLTDWLFTHPETFAQYVTPLEEVTDTIRRLQREEYDVILVSKSGSKAGDALRHWLKVNGMNDLPFFSTGSRHRSKTSLLECLKLGPIKAILDNDWEDALDLRKRKRALGIESVFLLTDPKNEHRHAEERGIIRVGSFSEFGEAIRAPLPMYFNSS